MAAGPPSYQTQAAWQKGTSPPMELRACGAEIIIDASYIPRSFLFSGGCMPPLPYCPRQRKPAIRKGNSLLIERLEDRLALSAAPMGFGPLPSVTTGLMVNQIDHADVVIDWNATALRAAWNAATSPTHASRVYAMMSTAV